MNQGKTLSLNFKKQSSFKTRSSQHIVCGSPQKSPTKFIRKQTRYNSSTQQSPMKTLQSSHQQPELLKNIDHAIELLQIISKHKNEKKRLFHVRSCSVPDDRRTLIQNLVDQMLPPSNKLDLEIESKENKKKKQQLKDKVY
ncbi:hypothetical protein pb186bvf_016660 [Paramecium bursaria]